MSDQQQQQAPGEYHTFKLPSGGDFYGGSLPDGEVKVRRFKTREETIMASESMSAFQKMGELFKATVQVPEGFKYSIDTPYGTMNYGGLDGLLSTDRLAILIFQRQITFGKNYLVDWRCKSCGNQNQSTIDVAKDLQFRTNDDVRNTLGEVPGEPFKIELPDSKAVLFMRHLRVHDEAIINHESNKAKTPGKFGAPKSGAGFNINNFIRNLRTMAVAQLPNWNQMFPIEREDKFWNELSWNDAQALDWEIEKRETGVDPELSVPCNACGNSQLVKMQYGPEFFRPTRR